MASDDKETKTNPAPKNETGAKKEAVAKKKDESPAEGQERAGRGPIQGRGRRESRRLALGL